MKKIVLFLGVIALLTACNQQNNTSEAATDANAEVAKTEYAFIPLKDMQAEGENFLDKDIQTKGLVDHVCKHGGKKLLLVDDNVSLHVVHNERFEDAIMGKEIIVTGTVKEDRIDEAYLLQLEEEAINSHSEGEDTEIRQERIINFVKTMRDSLASEGVDHFSEYYLQFIALEEAPQE